MAIFRCKLKQSNVPNNITAKCRMYSVFDVDLCSDGRISGIEHGASESCGDRPTQTIMAMYVPRVILLHSMVG